MGRILHLGLGAFHRAHQAAFTTDAGDGWSITAVAMRNPALADALHAAKGRYHLVERHPEGPRVQPMTVIDRALCLATDPAAVLAAMADPEVHVVTMTVTEKGYGHDAATRRLDPGHPAIAPDLAQPRQPRGLIGALVGGLGLRRAAGLGGLTVISCDNLSGNGHLTARLVDDFARMLDPALADWIAQTCAFPDSMVDRITPASTPATFDAVRAATGLDDPLAVDTEPFRQWVIEDRFAGPRPGWADAGALIVASVTPFESMKLRLLNGSHSLIAYMGALAGHDAVRDVMAEPHLRSIVAAHMPAAAATLDPIAGFDPATYQAALLQRFANPQIRHRCLQIAADGSQKLPSRIFAAAADAFARGQSPAPFAAVTAAWIRFLGGQDDKGGPLAPVDPLAQALMAAAAHPTARAAVLAVGQVAGLADHGLFARGDWADAVALNLDQLRTGGVAGWRP
jgi:fructuronate reductase